jgi:hypothetical protein
MRLFQKAHVMAGMHVEDRSDAVIAGIRALEPQRLERLDQGGGPAGILERMDDPAMHHELLRLMGQLRL